MRLGCRLRLRRKKFLPGFDLASAISSLYAVDFLASACTTSTTVTALISAIGVKSFTRSNGIFAFDRRIGDDRGVPPGRSCSHPSANGRQNRRRCSMTAPGFELHDDLLAENLAHAVGQHPRADVGHRTRRKPDHQPDRPGRKISLHRRAAVVALIATIATAAAIRRVERNNALIPILPASRRPHLSVT